MQVDNRSISWVSSFHQAQQIFFTFFFSFLIAPNLQGVNMFLIIAFCNEKEEKHNLEQPYSNTAILP